MIRFTSGESTTQFVISLAMDGYIVYRLGMKINEYINLAPNRASARRELAHALGKKEVTVRSWANGTRHPARSAWPKIFQATNGLVTVNDLI